MKKHVLLKAAGAASPAGTQKKLVALLNACLADTIDLQMQAKMAHWNVKGAAFIALHELFDQVAAAVAGYVDMIAELAVQLGGEAAGSVQDIGGQSRLTPYPHGVKGAARHVSALTQSLLAVADTSRGAIDASEALGDKVTADLFTEIAGGLDKWRWFVESHVQG